MTMKCSKCGQSFRDGDHIMATVLSIYHEIAKPEMDQFRYAISRPHAATNLMHLVCGEAV